LLRIPVLICMLFGEGSKQTHEWTQSKATIDGLTVGITIGNATSQNTTLLQIYNFDRLTCPVSKTIDGPEDWSAAEGIPAAWAEANKNEVHIELRIDDVERKEQSSMGLRPGGFCGDRGQRAQSGPAMCSMTLTMVVCAHHLLGQRISRDNRVRCTWLLCKN
jgi:hypothetical protein